MAQNDLGLPQPPDQASLNMWGKWYAERSAAPNEIVRSKIDDKWTKSYCDARHKITKFENWTGKVSTINWNGYFEVNLGSYQKMYDITIKPGSKLFDTISTLREGQPVKISGSVIPDPNPAGCNIMTTSDMDVIMTKISPL
jgi:hypothetical protein